MKTRHKEASATGSAAADRGEQDAQEGVSRVPLLCLRPLFFSFCILHSAFLPACPPDWITFPHYLGYASPTGSFHYWRGIAAVDFGKGLRIPVRFVFDSAREDPSPYLGTGGWRCVLLEAGVVQKFPGCLEVTLLGGQKLYLVQDKAPAAKSPQSRTTYQSQDGHWRAEKKSDQLEVVRDCGWAMKFHVSRSGAIKGRIASLTTDQGRTLIWEYIPLPHPQGVAGTGISPSKGTMAIAIREAGSRAGGPALEIQFDPGAKPGALPTALVIRSDTPGGIVTWKYALMFAPVESDPDELTLQSVTWPDGTKETYALKSALSDSPLATRHSPSASLIIASPDRGERTFTWEPATGRILSDCDGWKYRVGALKSDWERPPVSRTNKAGQREFYYQNLQAGITTYQAPTGTVTRRHYLQTPGPTFMYLKKVQKIDNGKTAVDEYEWDHFGNQTASIKDGVFLWKKTLDEKGRVTHILTTNANTFIAYLNNGWYKTETILSNEVTLIRLFDAQARLKGLCYADGAKAADITNPN